MIRYMITSRWTQKSGYIGILVEQAGIAFVLMRYMVFIAHAVGKYKSSGIRDTK
jgi:hypothetical protein